MPLIPEFARQSQADFCEFKASLVYKVSSRTARTVTQRNPVSKNKRKNQTKLKHPLIHRKYMYFLRQGLTLDVLEFTM